MVDGRFRKRWDKSILDLNWSDKRFFDILGSLKMDSSVHSTENSFQSGSWGSRGPGSGRSQVGNSRLVGEVGQPTSIVYRTTWNLGKACLYCSATYIINSSRTRLCRRIYEFFYILFLCSKSIIITVPTSPYLC
jgi:hypothetical protein